MVLIGLGTLPQGRASEPISPQRLVEVVDIGQPVVSPNGRKVAFRIEQGSVQRNTYDSVWYVQDMDGAPARKVAEGGPPMRESAGPSLPAVASWSPDGRWIYFRAFMDGRIDVWRAAVDGSGSRPMTLDPADVRDFDLSDDGTVLAYSVGATRAEVTEAETAEYDQGIHIDSMVPVGQGLFRSGAIEGRLATQRVMENEVERVPLLANVPDRWVALDLGSGAKRALARPPARTRQLAGSALASEVPDAWRTTVDPQGDRVVVLSRTGEAGGLRDKPGIVMSMLPGRKSHKAVRCEAEPCAGKAISTTQWRPNSDEVVFTITDDSMAQSIFRWNVLSGQVHPVAHSDGLLNGGRGRYSTCGVSFAALACVTADAGQPPRLERVDVESGHRQVLFDPNASLADDVHRTVQVRPLQWTDTKGQKFTGKLYSARRLGETAPPLFVAYYWCPGFVRGGYGDEWPLMTLASRGISALCINYAPIRLDAVERYDQGLSALESAVKLLASTDEIDPSRVGMGGLSLSTEVTWWSVMNSDLLTAASVSSLGISPQYYLLLSMKSETFSPRLREYWQLGGPDETPERWHRLSPAYNLDKVRAPVLMQLPEQEYIHTLDYAIPLIRDHRADLYAFPNEPHQKIQPRHKLAVYERNLDWFLFWLLEIEDAAPTKLAQYERWRAMKERVSGER